VGEYISFLALHALNCVFGWASSSDIHRHFWNFPSTCRWACPFCIDYFWDKFVLALSRNGAADCTHGEFGSGFSAQIPPELAARLPDVLCQPFPRDQL